MPADQHEIQIVNGGSAALLTFYKTIPYDLSSYGVGGQGWLDQSGFQEVDIASGNVLFEWYSTEHVDLSNTQIAINTTDAVLDDNNGLTPHSGFDYL